MILQVSARPEMRSEMYEELNIMTFPPSLDISACNLGLTLLFYRSTKKKTEGAPSDYMINV